MRLFVAIRFNEGILDALEELQADHFLLMNSERGKNGMVYSEIGFLG